MKMWKPTFENELIVLPDGGAVQKASDEAFAAATKSGDYLPRLQLMTSNSQECKSGKFPINHYALVSGQNYKDCGTDVDVLVIAWRPKAIEMGETVITCFDVNNKEFTRICDKSGEKDSGCMFGPEFLMWVPSQKEFATFFMGSKSSRRESPNVKALLKKAATLKGHMIETAKYSWYSPIVVPCTTPFEIPAIEDIMDEVQKFNNPPVTEIEKVEGGTTSDRAR